MEIHLLKPDLETSPLSGAERIHNNNKKKKLERNGFHYLCFNEFLPLEASSEEVFLNAFENNFHSVPPDC